MMKKNRVVTIIVILIAGLFVWALLDSFALRFERGDIYPPYSSFRADPVGCKVLFDSLEELPAIKVKRLLRPIDELEEVENSVMIVTGIRRLNRLDKVAGLNNYLLRGGNLLVFCHPVKKRRQNMTIAKNSAKSRRSNSNTANSHADGEENSQTAEGTAVTAAKEMLPLKHSPFRWLLLQPRRKLYRLPLTAEPNPALQQAGMPQLPLYTYGYLKFYGRNWRTLYRCHGKPVIIQAQYGRGVVTVSAASYFISNEAMLKKPPVRLISHLLGNREEIIFNERINGVGQQHNIAWLIRKYRLPLLLFNLLAVALLYAWRSFLSSANHVQRSLAQQLRQEQFSVTSGLTKLLQRHIPPAQLLARCLEEWRRQPKQKRLVDDRQLQELIQTRAGTTVEKYNAIVELIKRPGKCGVSEADSTGK